MKNANKDLTLNLYLPDGSPEDCVVVKSFNWTGECIMVLRSNIEFLESQYPSDKSGVYFLLNDNNDSPTVYIGESENLVNRINQHLTNQDKDWFEKVIIFTSSNDLSRGHIETLVYKLIKMAEKSLAYTPTNRKGGAYSSSEYYINSEVDKYLDYIVMIMPILGYKNLLDKDSRGKSNSQENDNILKPNSQENNQIFKYKDAKCMFIEGKFKILKYSKINRVLTNSCPEYIKCERELLFETGVINRTTFIFEQDFDFKTPTRAAVIVRGGTVNGRTAWRNDAGTTINSIIRESKVK